MSRQKPAIIDWPSRVALFGVIVASLVHAGCMTTTGAFQRGDEAALQGDWDRAVDHFRQALQEDRNDASARVAFERAMQNAAQAHVATARELEARGDLPTALAEYRRASEYDPTNGGLMSVAAALERRIRDLVEAAQPPSALEQLEAQARRDNQPPLLDPASDELRTWRFSETALRDILDFIGAATGINVTYDPTFNDQTYSVSLEDVTVVEALDQILTATENFYKVRGPRSLIVIPDTPPKRAQYEEQVIRTFYISHADVTELSTMLVQIVRAPTLAVQPAIVANPTSHTITVRATTAVAEVIAKVISANDKPRAEIIVDVEILEVNRDRAREFGLDLASYSIGALFSPTTAPEGVANTEAAGSATFNANVLSEAFSPADFYLAVPAAVVRFLEADENTRLVAKPQLRGQEGIELTLNLGDDIPVPSTSFTAIATGGVSVNPLTSFEYRPIGVNLIMTPRVTYDNEIILELEVENSTLGPNINVAGQALPTFGTRKVQTTIRLRDGESNLLAGLLREEERRSLRGFPGILNLPIIRQLFSANEDSIKQTDVVMLLTPRIVRTHELTVQDVSPVFIGTSQNMGVTGPPPLIQSTAAATGLAPSGFGPSAAALPIGEDPTTAVGGDNERSPRPVFPAESTPTPTFLPGDLRPTFGAAINVNTPATDFMVGGGPYTVPISIRGASQLSTLSLSLTFDPSLLRVRTVQEGSFMNQGSVGVTFAQDVDTSGGRVDVALTRTDDMTGAAGDGLVAAVVFDAIGPGATTLSANGMALTPAGAPLTLDFEPTTVSVR